MKVLIVFYSMYGHIYRMAEAVAAGAKEVENAQVEMRRAPETLPEGVLVKMGAVEPQKGFSHVPVCTLEDAAIVGNTCLPLKSPTHTYYDRYAHEHEGQSCEGRVEQLPGSM